MQAAPETTSSNFECPPANWEEVRNNFKLNQNLRFGSVDKHAKAKLPVEDLKTKYFILDALAKVQALVIHRLYPEHTYPFFSFIPADVPHQ